MNISIKDTVELYFEKINSGEMDFSHLRKTLKSENYTAEEIEIIVKRLDRNLIRTAELKHYHSTGKNLFIGGLIIMIAGVLITVFTYTGIIDLGNIYIVAYGPILSGLLMAIIGKMKMNR